MSYFYFFHCLLDLSCGECNAISLYFLCRSLNGSVCLVWCVSDSIFTKQFAVSLGMVSDWTGLWVRSWTSNVTNAGSIPGEFD